MLEKSKDNQHKIITSMIIELKQLCFISFIINNNFNMQIKKNNVVKGDP
jgi:hypothetical protein